MLVSSPFSETSKRQTAEKNKPHSPLAYFQSTNRLKNSGRRKQATTAPEKPELPESAGRRSQSCQRCRAARGAQADGFTFASSHWAECSWSSRKEKWLKKKEGKKKENHKVVGGLKSDQCQPKAQRNYQLQATVWTLMLLKIIFPFSLKKERKILW